ncbi:MAG: ATP-binding protein [Leptospiraceae bacterium]|nr:ATP-binding protein [Leptospiraceae bacterium]
MKPIINILMHLLNHILKILLFIPIVSVSALPIDLTKEDIYLKKGFSEEWIQCLPKEDKSWKKIDGVLNGERSLQVPELLKNEIPKRNFLSWKEWKSEEFTFVTSFTISEKDLNLKEPLGLYLAIIGVNWRVYLNGSLLRVEEFLTQDGQVEIGRNIRRVLIPILPSNLKVGTNILAFKIIGNPTDVNTGFFRSKPYLIDTYNTLSEHRFDAISLILIFLYLAAGFFHLFIFFLRPKDSYNLYFSLLCFSLFLFNFLRSYTASDLITDSFFISRLEIAAIFSLVPFFSALMNTLLKGQPGKFTLFVTSYTVAFIFLLTIAPIPFVEDMLNVWNIITMTIPLPFYFGRICIEYFHTVKDKKQEKNSPNLLSAMVSSLLKTIPGNLLIGTLVIATCSTFDILDNLLWNTGVVLVRYGFFAFVVGITAILINRFLDVHRKIERLNIELEKNIEDLSQANQQITRSEEKYRLLVEGTNDIIFTLDKDWNFLSMNKSAKQHLGMQADKLVRTSLFALIHTTPIERKKTIRLIREKLKEFTQTKNPINFKISLLSAFNAEPREFQLHLEYIGKEEILGKASRVLEDALLKYIKEETQAYEIENYLLLAEDMSRRLVRNLERHLNSDDITSIRVSLREIIINAIEHGNLQLTFEEKTQALIEDNYPEFLKSRQLDPVLGNRKVKIEYTLDSEKVIYQIEDEGNGFDHKKIRKKKTEDLNLELEAHGRGIKMTEEIFDAVEYNEKGNSVTLMKKLKTTD